MDPVRASTRYSVKTTGARAKEILDVRKPSMTSRFGSWAVAQSRIVEGVKGVLASTTVLSVDLAKYIAFALEGYSLSCRLQGVQLVDEVSLALAKWQARGCVNANLVIIRNNVLSIPAPTPPGP